MFSEPRSRAGSFASGALAAAAAFVLAACGTKGPPHPPLPKVPAPVRAPFLRQSGDALELQWARPEKRMNGQAIEGALSYTVLARIVERPAAPAPPPPGPDTGGTAEAGPGGASVPGAGGEGADSAEEAFLKGAAVVARINEPPAAAGKGAAAGKTRAGAGAAVEETTAGAGAAAEKTRAGAGAPEGAAKGEAHHGGGSRKGPGTAAGPRAQASAGEAPAAPAQPVSATIPLSTFKGARLSSARLQLAVVAVDADGRRSRPRPILELDPVEPLPAPSRFQGRAGCRRRDAAMVAARGAEGRGSRHLQDLRSVGRRTR